MASTSRNLPRQHGLWLIVGGSVTYLTVIAIAAGVAISMASVDDARERKERARRAEPRPPIDLIRVTEVDLQRIPPNPPQAKTQLVALVQKIRGQEQMGDPDGFVKGLIRERSDLQGLPFLMGGK